MPNEQRVNVEMSIPQDRSTHSLDVLQELDELGGRWYVRMLSSPVDAFTANGIIHLPSKRLLVSLPKSSWIRVGDPQVLCELMMFIRD